MAVILAGTLAASAALADEMCMACEEPAGSYRCKLEQVPQKYSIGKLQEKVCGKVLERDGPHKRCRIATLPEGEACTGVERAITLADYQRAIGSSDASTYEVGALEKARRGLNDTWLCVTSMFKDC